MAVSCEIIPAANLSGEQLRCLGMALVRWYKRESGDDTFITYFNDTILADLSIGKPPPTLLEQYEALLDTPTLTHPLPPRLTPKEQAHRRSRLREELGDSAGRRCIYVEMLGRPYFDRKRTIDSLRQDISADLVQDVFIDKRSWDSNE